MPSLLAKYLQKMWVYRAFLLRILLCWVVGIAVLLNERSSDFDSRFKIRGPVLKNDDITLILVSEDEWLNLKNKNYQTLRPLKEIETLSDSFFSDTEAWGRLLSHILKLGPKTIGVTLFISEPSGPRTPAWNTLINSPKLIWAARVDSDGQLQRPRSGVLDDRRLGLVDLRADGDGYMRRIQLDSSMLASLPLRLAKTKKKNLEIPADETQVINFQGKPSTFLTFTLTELLFGTLPENAIKNKIVIIGARGTAAHTMLTPVGPMTKAEIVANVTNNILQNQWIRTLPLWMHGLILLALLFLSVKIVTSYTQYIAAVFLFGLWALYVGLSTWVFDVYYLWIPLVAPTAQLMVTFVVFLSYQLVINEQENWKLQQEKRYLKEIEEIKNNFLSLVSHDLKTPIAKIQAVADRLLTSEKDEKLNTELKVVKSASQDLHRYIQSLLQVIRVESTDFRARKTPADINELLNKVVEELLPLAKEKNIALLEDLEPMFSIELDSTLIYEVILNLVENAIKYTPNGGSVTVKSREIDDSVEVTVTDTGEGIPQEEVDKVWNKFYRGKKHDQCTKGSGLGLYLSKYFIQLHGGEVFLTTQVGVGTTIGFKLPLIDESAEAEGAMI